MEINKLKNEKMQKYKIYKDNNEFIHDNITFKKMNYFRQKMAFYYRYRKNPVKTNSLENKFIIQNRKYNKILQMSRTKPSLLIFNMRTGKHNINQSCDNCKEINIYENNKLFKEYSFLSPFKGNRYSGSIYDYYKSNNWLIKDSSIFPESKCENNENNIYEEINPINNQINNENCSQVYSSKSDNKKVKNNHKHIKLSNGKKAVKLSSLL